MAKARDMAKERYWRRIVRRHATSRLGTREFCTRHGVAAHQLYWWRRELQARDADVAGSGDESATSDRDRPLADGDLFFQLPLPISPSVTPMEVVHPRGHVIRVSAANFDAALLRRILETLDSPEAC
jgi:hypothetical protein